MKMGVEGGGGGAEVEVPESTGKKLGLRPNRKGNFSFGQGDEEKRKTIRRSQI